jgi:drug/metabolite transporter (DMT)-like permease
VGLSRRLQADLWIVALSAIWGCTFVLVKRTLEDISPLLFVFLRFCLASVPMFLMVPRGTLAGGRGDATRSARVRGTLVGGAVTGLLLFAGFVCQTIGIQYTTPSRSAFITGMCVVFTPLLSILLGRRRPSINSLVGVVLATVGLHLLTNPGAAGGGFGRGEALTLLCAIAFAGHLISLDHYTRLFDKRAIAFLQVGSVALLAAPPALLAESIRFNPTTGLFLALAVTSLVGTALAFLILNTVQSWTTPTRAAILFSAEPVFAAVTSWVVEGEVLAGAALLGAALILAGMLTAEVGPFGRRQVEVSG